VGLLSSIGNFAKKVVKVIDNPLTRAGLSASGLGAVGATLSAAAGNQAAVNAYLGASQGAVYQGGPATVIPQIVGKSILLGNSLFPTIPGVSGMAPGGASPSVLGYTLTKKRRRMNPANIKAARRAIRRIRGTRRVLQRIERLLPTRTVHSRRK